MQHLTAAVRAEGLVISLLHVSAAWSTRSSGHRRADGFGVPVTASPTSGRRRASTSAPRWPSSTRTCSQGAAATSKGSSRRSRARASAMPHVTKSNGGIMPVAAARTQTAATLLSGPASGVIGAAYVASRAGLPNIITLDVGGTSADMAVVENGRPRVSTSEHIGGVPVMMPVVGVSAIGAGGGSVAWVDDVGLPKVGPQSTGRAGPACYGRGGKDATLTDAFLVSGFSTWIASSVGACAWTGRWPKRPSPASRAGSRMTPTKRPRASCGSPSRTCTRSSPRSCRAPPSIPATSAWSPGGAGRWSARSSRARSASPPCSSRARRARSAPSARSAPTS